MDFLPDYLLKLPAPALEMAEYVVIWIGFSTLVGVVAKGIVFGRARTTTIVTILLGFIGTILGISIANLYTNLTDKITGSWKEQLLNPVTFLVATCGALGLLFFYKLLAGRFGLMQSKDT